MSYDAKAVKVPKSIKRAAAQILDNHERGEFIRSYVEIAKSELRTGNRKEK